MGERINGQCLCGKVSFDIGEYDRIDACHCKMCQRWSGGPFIGADLQTGDIRFNQEASLKWYESSDWAKRGFCSDCGSSLFYRLKDNDGFWAIASGALDLPDGQQITKEIFVDEKPSYYDLAGDRPRYTGPEFMAKLNGGDE